MDKENDQTLIRPDVSSKLATKILFEYFEITAVILTEVNGYFDRNFYVQSEDGAEYILKASNAIETESKEYLLQNKVLSLLHKEGLGVQLPLTSIHGNQTEVIAIETRISKNGPVATRKHAFRVLTFVPGCALDDKKVCVDAALLRDFGATVARVDRTLSRDLTDLQPPDDMLWCLQSVPKLRDFVFAVQEAADRELVLSVVAAFEREVLPRIGSLTKGVIHGDANAGNVIVRQRSSTTVPVSFEVVGLIDWQECHCAPVIFELAILCMYCTSAHKDSWDLDALSCPTACIEGFSSEWKLPESELSLLPILISARFAQSLCLGAYTYYILDPTNDYLLTTARNGWRLLRLLMETDRETLLKQWGLII